MKKPDLVAALAAKSAESHASSERVLDALCDTIREQLAQGGDVMLPGIGKFSTAERAARQGRNPQTGEPLAIPAATVPKFSAAKALKDAAAQ